MTRVSFVLAACFVLTAEKSAPAQEHPVDPLQSQLVAPELLVRHRAEIGLSDEQLDKVRTHLEEFGGEAADRQEKLSRATQKLSELLDAETVDEPAALAQLDEVLAAERELKRLHLQAMIRIRNELSGEQWRRAVAIQQQAGDPHERFQRKLTRIQEEVQRLAESGQPPLEAVQLMQAFPGHMQAGRLQQAEDLLDRVLRMLDLEIEEGTQSPDRREPEFVPDEVSAALSEVPVMAALPADALRQDVADMKQDDVAWRKIAWETCLISGLQRSREENKPVMLWIFIDRPIDDERC